uniref:Uncharacterized protein n=1 Tax=Anguilla anguilla TaxID=7936 RepID=A0A0E9WJI0_ANGAN
MSCGHWYYFGFSPWIISQIFTVDIFDCNPINLNLHFLQLSHQHSGKRRSN